MEQYYYPRTIKMVTTALLDMFNDIVIRKFESSEIFTSAVMPQPYVDEYNVPLMFGPIEKAQMERLAGHYYDSDGNEQGERFYMTLPRMALMWNGIQYDPKRAYGVNEWRYWFEDTLGIQGVDAQNAFADYQPSPYNMNYSLHIRANKLDNLSQILENILPYFNPKLFLRVKEFSFLNVERDLPVSMDIITPEFVEDQGKTDERYVNATLNLTVEAWQYRPWTTSKIIHVINSGYWVGEGDGYTLADRFSTSGFDTSGGILHVSATGMSAVDGDDLVTSGQYTSGSKDFYWGTTFSAGPIN